MTKISIFDENFKLFLNQARQAAATVSPYQFQDTHFSVGSIFHFEWPKSDLEFVLALFVPGKEQFQIHPFWEKYENCFYHWLFDYLDLAEFPAHARWSGGLDSGAFAELLLNGLKLEL